VAFLEEKNCSTKCRVFFILKEKKNTVKPVLRGSIHMKCSIPGQEKSDLTI
jgi:hypothetical protein